MQVIDSLLPDGTKPLLEPMWTDRQWGLVAFTKGQFRMKCPRYLYLIWVWILLIKLMYFVFIITLQRIRMNIFNVSITSVIDSMKHVLYYNNRLTCYFSLTTIWKDLYPIAWVFCLDCPKWQDIPYITILLTDWLQLTFLYTDVSSYLRILVHGGPVYLYIQWRRPNSLCLQMSFN